MRRVAEELGGVDQLEHAEERGEDGERHADGANQGADGGARCSEPPDDVDDAAGKGGPCNDVDKGGFGCVHIVLLK